MYDAENVAFKFSQLRRHLKLNPFATVKYPNSMTLFRVKTCDVISQKLEDPQN